MSPFELNIVNNIAGTDYSYWEYLWLEFKYEAIFTGIAIALVLTIFLVWFLIETIKEKKKQK